MELVLVTLSFEAEQEFHGVVVTQIFVSRFGAISQSSVVCDQLRSGHVSRPSLETNAYNVESIELR